MVIGLCPKGIRQSRNVNVSKLRFASGGWPSVGLVATDIPFCGGLSQETARLEPNFGNLAASGPQLKPPSGTIRKRPGFGQILAGSLLEPNFGNLAASGPQVKPPSGTIGKRPVLGQILAGEPFGDKFWQFGGFKAAIKTAFWNYKETARFGPNPSRDLLEPNFSNLAASRPQLKPPSGTIGKRPVLGQILAGAFWSQILVIWRLPGRN